MVQQLFEKEWNFQAGLADVCDGIFVKKRSDGRRSMTGGVTNDTFTIQKHGAGFEQGFLYSAEHQVDCGLSNFLARLFTGCYRLLDYDEETN